MAPDLTLDTNTSSIAPAKTTIGGPERTVVPAVEKDHVSTKAPMQTEAVLHTYKRAPGEIVRGEGIYLYDADGKRYLDFVSGIAVNALGYSDPGLVAALHAAADGLVHVSNLYETAPAKRLAEALVAQSFADKVFFC